MNEWLKLAFELGKQVAKEEHDDRLKEELKKRTALVGWKEKSVAPPKLSKGKA